MKDLIQQATEKQRAIIVDLDETLCTQFDVPIDAGVKVLQRIDESKLHVHYVTARTIVCREGTEKFIRVNRLPGARNVHYGPDSLSSFEHKRRLHESLSREFEVIASIGDSLEEQRAATGLGIYFVEVDPCEPSSAWANLAERLAEFTSSKSAR